MVKRKKLGRGVAVIGAGMSKFGMFMDKDSKDLFAEAFNETIASVDKGNEAGERQIKSNNLHTGAAHNLGGTGGTCTFTILERR